jgi:hypothetical protein
MSRSAEDLVRVQWGTMNDGLAGLMWRDGLSDPLVRHRAENLCLLLGQDAHVIELGADLAPIIDPPPAAPAVTPEPPAEPVELAREAPPLGDLADASPVASDAAPVSDATKTVTARAPRRS